MIALYHNFYHICFLLSILFSSEKGNQVTNKKKMEHMNFISWDIPMTQICHLFCLDYFWSQCWEISLSCSLALTPSSTPPCTSCSPSCLWLISLSFLLRYQGWSWTSKLRAKSSPMRDAWNRCLFYHFWELPWYAPDCEGLWQVRGSLTPAAIPHHHKPLSMWFFTVCLFLFCLCSLLSSQLATFYCVKLCLLQECGNWQFILWTFSNYQSCLFWSHYQIYRQVFFVSTSDILFF